MKQSLSFLALICFALGATPAYSQSPWVTPPNGFTLFGSSFINTVVRSPQPNTLAGICNSSSGMGVSSSQAFLTDDNGQTWQQQNVASTIRGTGLGSAVGTYAVDMFMLDGQHAWLLSQNAGTTSSLIFSRSTTGLAGLVALPNSLPAAFTKIHFFTPSVGLALASTPLRIFRTIDGGSTWNVVASATATGTLIDFPFITAQGVPNTAWMFTDNAVLRTTDTGLTWTTAPIPARFRNVAFENSLQGLSVGAQDLFRTMDGGLTWTPVGNSSLPVLTSITAIPGQPGTYMGVGSTYTARQYVGITSITRDGGNTWQISATDAIDFSQIVATSPSHIWAGTARSNPTPLVSQLLRYTGTALATKHSASLTPSLFAYPNPSTGIVQLTGPLAGKETVCVYDAAGRLCQQMSISDAHRTVDLSAQAPGLYLLKLTAPDGTVRTQRLSRLP